jgi:hypothetical protein
VEEPAIITGNVPQESKRWQFVGMTACIVRAVVGRDSKMGSPTGRHPDVDEGGLTAEELIRRARLAGIDDDD